jgi:hypothetical protein
VARLISNKYLFIQIAIGTKRKREEREQSRTKKAKIISSAKEITTIPDLPVECWEHIISFISSQNSAIAIFFVSKIMRSIYCRCLDRQISLDLGLPFSKAAFFPIDLKRIYSKIDAYVLLERAIAAAKLNKFDELLVVSDRLQKLTNMLILAPNGIEKLVSPMTYEHHIGGLVDRYYEFSRENFRERAKFCRTLSTLRKKYSPSVVYTSLAIERAALNEGSDGQLDDTTQDLSFYWFGTNKVRYIEAKLQLQEGHDSMDGMDWHVSECQVTLKKLGSDFSEKFHLSSFFVMSPSFTEEEEPLSWPKETVQRIIDWLGFEMTPVQFFCSFPSAILDEPDAFSVQVFREKQEWDGQIIQGLEAAQTLFLRDEQAWCKKLEFLMARIKIKLILLNRVKAARFSTKNARNEFLTLIEHASLIVQLFRNHSFTVPGSWGRNEIDSSENLSFIMGHNGRKVQMSVNTVFGEKNVLFTVKSPNENFTLGCSQKDLEMVIKLLELKHVKVTDLQAVIEKLAHGALDK